MHALQRMAYPRSHPPRSAGSKTYMQQGVTGEIEKIDIVHMTQAARVNLAR